MEFDADARRNIAERELLLPCRVELRQVCRIREQKCRSTEFGEKHIEVPLASNERLIFLGITSAQRDPDEIVHTVVEVREERVGLGVEPKVSDDLEQTAGKCRSEEHTSELQSLMRISYAVFCLKNKTKPNKLSR